MTHLWLRRKMIVFIMLCSLPAFSACQSGDAAGTPAATAAAGTPAVTQLATTLAVTPAAPTPAATPAVAVQPSPTAVPTTSSMVFGAGPFNFLETKAGLSDLTGYKATLSLSFNGTRAGKSQQWTKTYVLLNAQKPAARQLTIEKTGDLSDLDPVYMAEADGTAYERLGKNACKATAIEQGNSRADQMEPAGFLTGVIGADEAGSDTIDGAAAAHYTFDEHALGQSGLTKSKGELWVAAGGYIVRYKAATVAAAAFFGEGIKGTLTWDYQLSGVNQPVTVALPKDCPPGMVDAPLLPGATAVVKRPGLLSYSTAGSVADAAAFYQTQLPSLGWQPQGEPVISPAYDLLDYSQGAKTMTVIITAGKVATSVQIVMPAAAQ